MRPFILSAAAAAVSFANVGTPAPQGEKQERVTLLGILSQWQYPGSKMLDGATMQDGGNSALPSTFCHSVLTTPDSVEKVVGYYTGKPNASDNEKQALQKPKAMEGGCILVQDDSKNRPMVVKVIVVNKAESATTLVVTRAKDESETHIAWTHHLRHNVGR